MRNYFFTTLKEDKEKIDFYKSLSKQELIQIFNMNFDNINYNLIYYSHLLKEIFKGSDYDEHYYNLLSLTEDLNDIKIIINLLKGGRFYE